MKRKSLLGRPKRRWKGNIRTNVIETRREGGLDLSGWGQKSPKRSFVHDPEKDRLYW